MNEYFMTDLLIIILGFLILSLDSKVWRKIDRLVNLIIYERTEMSKEISDLKKLISAYHGNVDRGPDK